MSLITPDFGLLFWMVIIFAIVFFVLAKFGFPMITSMVEERNSRISESIEKARKAEKALEEIVSTQKAMIEEARRQQAETLKEASAAKDAIIAQARAEAKQEAAKLVEEARVQIAAEKESAMMDVRSKIAEISIRIAEAVVKQKFEDKDVDARFIEKMLDETSEIIGNNK